MGVHPLTILLHILVLLMHTVFPHPTTPTSHVHPMLKQNNHYPTKSLMTTSIIHWKKTLYKRMALQLTPCTVMVAQTLNSWWRGRVARTRRMALVVNRAIIPQEYSCVPSNYSDGILKNTD